MPISFDYLLLLALIQGVTEFLPISSSGHLALLHDISGQRDQGVLLDVALHLGTLCAVMVYFRRDCALLARSTCAALIQPARLMRGGDTHLRALLIASLPVLLGGAALVASGMGGALRAPHIIGWACIIFALPLYLADRFGGTQSGAAAHMRPRHALIIGAAQMLALIPGASRAGLTITAARALGFDREQAARFSMLLAIPVILAFALAAGVQLIRLADWDGLARAALAALMAGLVAFTTIHIFLTLLRRISLLPFILYRLALGLWLIMAF